MHVMKTYLKHTGTLFCLFAMVLSCSRPPGLNNLDPELDKNSSNLNTATPSPQIIMNPPDPATLQGGCYMNYKEDWKPPKDSVISTPGPEGQCQSELIDPLIKYCYNAWKNPNLSRADPTAAIIGGVLENFKFPPPSDSAADLVPEPTYANCNNLRTADSMAACGAANQKKREDYESQINKQTKDKTTKRWQTAKTILGSGLNALGAGLKSTLDQQVDELKQLNKDRIETAVQEAKIRSTCPGPSALAETLEFCKEFFQKAPKPCDSGEPDPEDEPEGGT